METSLCGLLATYEVASQKEEDAAQPEETTPRIHPALPEGPLQEDGENNPHGAQPGSRSTGRLMVQVLRVQGERRTHPRATLSGHLIPTSCWVLFFAAGLSLLQVIKSLQTAQIP